MIEQVSNDLLWSQVVARAWSDGAVMERLRSDPRALLAEHDLEIPEGTQVLVEEGTEVKVEETDRVRRFILTPGPSVELMDEDLVGDGVAWYCGACGRCGACGCRCRC
jgi:hypothetical protein